MSERYKETTLWIGSIGEINADTVDASANLERLRVAFGIFRERAHVLSAQIRAAFPNLTVHDITHLDALWETASLIAGPRYPLNPLEGFVLGGAFLLHDAALCYEAYEGGQEAVRDSIAWKDAFALEIARHPDIITEVAKSRADFVAVRVLHAQQASELATRSWNGMFLIDDTSLRNTFGPLIGRIASSHHWPIEDVAAQFTTQINSPANYPRDWRVNPLKIACLVRCADATHLDSRRAPDFLHGLARREGVSADHWIAQKWLAQVDIDQSDPAAESLRFSSLHNFEPSDSQAWWVAHDAICLANKEIATSNRVLASAPHGDINQFKVKKISGTETPESLSRYVTTIGWQPCSVQIHVSNLSSLIANLGGEKLYGDQDQFAIALREVIQNARDAVMARRAFDKDFSGKIRISVTESEGSQHLIIEDDGIGMSERVLTGPLLDFGTSFWASDMVRAEMPGLTSSKFRSVGQFGIGFYSVFMIADKVEIASRRWDHGLDATHTISFPHGLSLRPNLSRGRRTDIPPSVCTAVKLRLKTRIDPESITVPGASLTDPTITVRFSDYLRPLVAGIDVAVEYKGFNGEFEVVHEPISEIIASGKVDEWLRGISFHETTYSDLSSQKFDLYRDRLRPMIGPEGIVGLAALCTSASREADYMTVTTIGGLSNSYRSRTSNSFVGFVDYKPSKADRRAGSVLAADQAVLDAWAHEQINILKKDKITDVEWCYVTSVLNDFKCDPYSVFKCILQRRDAYLVVTLDQALTIALQGGIAFHKAFYADVVDVHDVTSAYKDFFTYRAIRSGNFNSLEMIDGRPRDPNTILGCLFRHAEKTGKSLILEKEENAYRTRWGAGDIIILRAG